MNSKAKKQPKDTITYINKNVGFSITIPDSWLEVRKSSYKDLGINENTLFAFAIDKFTIITAIFSGFCKKRNFNRFFDKVNLKNNFKIIKTGQKEYNNNISNKFILIETEDKKIMNNFCLINEMIINFTINIDPKNNSYKTKGLNNDKNYKLINNMLKNIETFKPVNPPILVEDRKKHSIIKEEIEEEMSLAKKYIASDCRYKNMLIPDFYLQYIYNQDEKEEVLNVIGSEVYFKELNDKFRIIKVNDDLASEIKEVINNNIDELVNMNSEEESNNRLVIKDYEKYIYINLSTDKTNLSLINDILSNITKIISKYNNSEVTNFTLNSDIEEIKEENKTDKCNCEENCNCQKESHEDCDCEVCQEEKRIIKDIVKELEEIEDLKKNVQVEETKNAEKICKEAELVLQKLNTEINEYKQLKVNKEMEVNRKKINEEAQLILIKLEDEINHLKNPPQKAIPAIIEKEATAILEKLDNEMKYSEHQQNQEKREYDLTTFDEYFHNIDGHASFKFLFPHASGEKVLRDFNVFDIVKEEVEYRVFIFKCENKEKYELKLDNWMEMNKTSNQCEIKDKYKKETENGLEIRTFIFENGKFYKVAYKKEYLLAVSGIESEEKLFNADLALDSVEIGEDNRLLIESQERKMRSIQILQSQNIPYIDELPPLASSYEIQGKNLEEIARRAMILCICCNFASDVLSNKKKRYLKESKKFFNKLIDKYFLRDYMTKEEKLLLDKMDKNLAIQISWQFEGYVVLLWTLGLVDEIPFPDTLVDPDSVTAIVSSCESYREFLEKCNLRTVHEVLDLADLTYRYNWYCVESKISNEEITLNPEIVMERHRALNWLLTDQKWDKVEINT